MEGRRLSGSVVAAVAVVAVIAGCGGGGSSKVSPSAYTKSVCAAFGKFINSIKGRESQLKLAAVPNTTPAQGKQLLATFVSGMTSDAHTLASDVKSAGVPDVSNGQQISSALQSAFSQFESALGTYQAQISQLPVTSPAAFKSASAGLTKSLQTSLAGIGAGLNGLKSPQLQQAASKTAACQTLSL